MCNITVVDAIMGEGKTIWAMNMMKASKKSSLSANSSKKWIYITVSLTELRRVKKECESLGLEDPVEVEGHKMGSFMEMIYRGESIVSTHQLFRYMTVETMSLIKDRGYTLIIDETFECVDAWDKLTKKERIHLEETGVISFDDDGTVLWNKDHPHVGKGKVKFYKELKSLIQNGNLILVRDKLFLWRFPVQFLTAFRDVYILTYMFENGIMSSYLKANGLTYKTVGMRHYDIADYNAVDIASHKTALWQLISLVEDERLNKIGKKVGKEQPLSAAWLKRECQGGASERVQQLQRDINTFFRRVACTPSKLNMWTCKKPFSKYLGGHGYQGGFVHMVERGTNNYRDKAACAYVANRFLLKPLRYYFQAHDVEVREDLYALTEMIQWVWRSRVRDGNPIHLFVPSERMRGIFKNWLRYNDVDIANGQRLDNIT